MLRELRVLAVVVSAPLLSIAAAHAGSQPPSITTTIPPTTSGPEWCGPRQSVPQPPGLPVQAPYPIGDYWFSQIFKWSAAPSQVPEGNEINPLPLNLNVGQNGLAIYHPYARSADSTVACGGGASLCPGFEAIQPQCFRPEIMIAPAHHPSDWCAYQWGATPPLTSVQAFSTWSATFDIIGPNVNACGGVGELQRIRATTARGSPYVWAEFPDCTDASFFDTVSVQVNDATGQIFFGECLVGDCPRGCDTHLQGWQIWTNESNFVTLGNSQGGSNQGQKMSQVAVVGVNGRSYALIGPEGSHWQWATFDPPGPNGYASATLYNIFSGGARWVVAAALPANLDALIAANQWTRADAVQLMVDHAYFRPANESGRTATKLSCSYTPGGSNNVSGVFSYEALTDIRTGQPAAVDQETLFALFPHQQAHLSTQSVLIPQTATYTSAKGYARSGPEPRGGFTDLPPQEDSGQMRLAKGRSFSLTYSLPEVPPVVPPRSSFTGDMDTLNSYLANDPSKYQYPLGTDTYNWGKHLSRAANNYLIATAVTHPTAEFWKTNLKDGLSGWFTATAPGGGPKAVEPPCLSCPAPIPPPNPLPQCPDPHTPGVFQYDAAWGSMIGYPAGFGSNEFLNDHHFHYGYFIRAAAVLGGADPAWLATYRPFVELLIRDLAAGYDDTATVGGIETKFAAFNYFDPYSGHANAAGAQQYANGINQESSSEGVNAWYGILLWGTLVNDADMAARGAFMYCSETDAARRYWFQEASQLAGTNPVTSGTLANVFDNVYQYGGFSRGATYLHIINWLPFGGGASYLAANKPYAAHNYARLLAEHGSTDWGAVYSDLIWMYLAISDPAGAKAQFNAKIVGNGNEFDCDSGNTLAMTYWWIWSQANVGGKFEPGDINQDGIVDGADLALVLGVWGACPKTGECPADVNQDGVVDGADLAIVLGNWSG